MALTSCVVYLRFADHAALMYNIPNMSSRRNMLDFVRWMYLDNELGVRFLFTIASPDVVFPVVMPQYIKSLSLKGYVRNFLILCEMYIPLCSRRLRMTAFPSPLYNYIYTSII